MKAGVRRLVTPREQRRFFLKDKRSIPVFVEVSSFQDVRHSSPAAPGIEGAFRDEATVDPGVDYCRAELCGQVSPSSLGLSRAAETRRN